MSGFGKGSRGHARIPDSLLGGLHNSQMIIVKCSSTGLPTVTEKFFLARARGLMVLSSGFLTAWSSHGKVPVLAEHSPIGGITGPRVPCNTSPEQPSPKQVTSGGI